MTAEYCKSKASVYLNRILDYIESTIQKSCNNRNHVLVSSWDQGTEIFGWSSSIHNRISKMIYLSHVGYKIADQTFNVEKDIVIPPYVPTAKINAIKDSYESLALEKGYYYRGILASFRGTVLSDPVYSRGSRQHLLKFKNSTSFLIQDYHCSTYWDELIRSKFSFCPMGWTYWTARMFESIIVETIPIVITEDFALLPFENIVDYSSIILRTTPEQFTQINNMQDWVDSINLKYNYYRKSIQKVKKMLTYNEKIEEGDAISLIVQELKEKIKSS